MAENQLALWQSKLSKETTIARIQGQCAPGLDANRIVRQTLRQMWKVPAIASCTEASVFNCIADCAQMGLEPVTGHVYFVPFGRECTLIIGYRGLLELARRSGNVLDIEVRVVHENDVFEVEYGLQENVRHIPNLRDPGEAWAYYCVIRFRGGGWQFTVMKKEEVDMIRNRSRASKSGPWMTDYDEMAKKTVLRRASKMWPLSIMDKSFTDAIEHNDESDPVVDVFPVSVDKRPSATEILKARLAARDAENPDVIDAESTPNENATDQ